MTPTLVITGDLSIIFTSQMVYVLFFTTFLITNTIQFYFTKVTLSKATFIKYLLIYRVYSNRGATPLFLRDPSDCTSIRDCPSIRDCTSIVWMSGKFLCQCKGGSEEI